MTLEALLGRIEGCYLHAVLVGPAGVHYDFARSVEQREPDYGILANTAIVLQGRGGARRYQAPPYADRACQADLQALLEGRRVVSAEYDGETGGARLLLEEAGLLSLLPSPKAQALCWSIHDHGQGRSGFLVYADALEPIAPLPQR